MTSASLKCPFIAAQCKQVLPFLSSTFKKSKI